MLSTAAFCVVNSGYHAGLDGAFPNVVKVHHPDTSVPHLMFLDPYLWDEDSLESRILGDKTVAWLQAVPISDTEMELLRDEGADALKVLFEQYQPDFVDLVRSSVV